MSKPHDSEFIGRRNFLKRATFVGAAVVTPELAVNAQRPSRNPVTQIPDELTADEVRKLLKLLIPGNTFHTARVIGPHRWFLGASTEWPGVEPVDVEIGNVDALAAKYPQVADDLRTFPVPVKE